MSSVNMNSLPERITPQYTNVDAGRVEYSYISRGSLLLDTLLTLSPSLERNLSLLNRDIQCILGDKYIDTVTDDNVYNLIEEEFKDIDFKHLFEFNKEFLRKLFSYQFYRVLQHAQDNLALPSGFPYLGKGYLHYESLVSSSTYEISKVATDRFQSFFNGALISGAVGVNDHYVFLGPGTGHEVLVLFDTIKEIEPNFISSLGSLVLIDLSKSVLEATFKTIDSKLPFDSNLLEYKALVGDFESIKIKPIKSSYLGSIINLLIGYTSGNFNCQSLLGILSNLTLDGSQVVVDTALYRDRSDLDSVITSYSGEMNKDFLLHNFGVCLENSGVDPRLVRTLYDSFAVDLVPDPYQEDFLSIQSSTSLNSEILAIIKDNFNIDLPERLVLMDSYRRKPGAFIDYLEANSFEFVSTRKFKGDPGDSMTMLIKKAL